MPFVLTSTRVIGSAAIAFDRGFDGVKRVFEREIERRLRTRRRETSGTGEIALRRYIEQIDARVLKVARPETVLVSHRHRMDRGGIRIDRARRHAPLLEIPPELRVFFIERPDLAVAAPAKPP
jgi:hypothetical protein